jgi:hypothetical protein
MKPRSTNPAKANAPRATTPAPLSFSTKPAKEKHRSTVPAAPPSKSALLLPEHLPLPDSYSVSISLFEPGARAVFLAGTFNDWNPSSTPLNRTGNGQWTIALALKPGRYEYRFVVDGEWRDDPTALHYQANPFGSLNAIIEIPLR